MLTRSLLLSRSIDLPVCLARFAALRLWLKDAVTRVKERPGFPSLEDSANLPDPDIIAAEIVEDLQAALAQFVEISFDLTNVKSFAGRPSSVIPVDADPERRMALPKTRRSRLTPKQLFATVNAVSLIVRTTSETAKSRPKKHPAEDFLRATKDARASQMAAMPAMISLPSIESVRLPKPKRQR